VYYENEPIHTPRRLALVLSSPYTDVWIWVWKNLRRLGASLLPIISKYSYIFLPKKICSPNSC